MAIRTSAQWPQAALVFRLGPSPCVDGLQVDGALGPADAEARFR